MSNLTKVTLVYLPAKKKTLTLSEYSFGWGIYKAVYLSAFPTEVLAMLTFENDICNLAQQGLNWLHYDEEFHRGMELHGYPLRAMRPYLDKVIYTSLPSTEASTSHSYYRPSQNSFRPQQQIFRTSQESFRPNFEGTERMSGNSESVLQKGKQDPDIPKGYCYQFHTRGHHCFFHEFVVVDENYEHSCPKCKETHTLCTKSQSKCGSNPESPSNSS